MEHIIMYTIDIFHNGIALLGITEPDIISNIHQTREENLAFIKEYEVYKNSIIENNNRFKVPFGLKKKEYSTLKKDTQKKIDAIREEIRKWGQSDMRQEEFNNLLKKKYTIQKHIDNNIQESSIDIARAKAYPIENLLEFNRMKKTKCLWHNEKTGSLWLDKKKNRVHCFAGCGNFDSIDVYMKINNVSFTKATEVLCSQ